MEASSKLLNAQVQLQQLPLASAIEDAHLLLEVRAKVVTLNLEIVS